MEISEEVRRLLAQSLTAPEDPPRQGVDDAALQSFEARVGTQIPAALADWLRTANGAPVGPGGLFGIGTRRKSLDIESYLKEYPEWLDQRWLPVAGDGTGNYYVLSCTTAPFSAPVLYIDTHDDPAKPAYVVASDLWHFLRFLLRTELGADTGWPFSRDKVVEDDPAIEYVTGVPYPWDA